MQPQCKKPINWNLEQSRNFLICDNLNSITNYKLIIVCFEKRMFRITNISLNKKNIFGGGVRSMLLPKLFADQSRTSG